MTTESDHDKPLAANLPERQLDDRVVNQARVADITCVATAAGWLYLRAVMNLASRLIVGWSRSERIKADLLCEASKSSY